MIRVLDPDVLVASRDARNLRCLVAVECLAKDALEQEFAVDDLGTVFREYKEFWDRYHLEEDHPAVRLVRPMMNLGESKLRFVAGAGRIGPDLQQLLHQEDCETEVEPQLVSIVAHLSDPDVELVLVGKCRAPARHRGLEDAAHRHAVAASIGSFKTLFASEATGRLSPARDALHVDDAEAYQFESLAPLSLQYMDAKFRCCRTPPGLRADFYGYRENEDDLEAVVGECKLRTAGNEEKLIERKWVEQLEGYALAAAEYEHRRDGAASFSVRVRGLLVSNALKPDEDARREFVAFNKKHHDLGIELEYLRAHLSADYARSNRWKINYLARVKIEEDK